MIKLIASDMDGTLLNEQMEISNENANAIKEAQAAGIEFLVATGRGLKEAKPFFDAANIKSGLITLNGAEVFNTDEKIVDTHKIRPDLVEKISEIFKSAHIYFELVTTKGVFSDSRENRVTSVAELMVLLNPELTKEKATKISEEKLNMMKTNYVDSYESIIHDSEYGVLKIIAFDARGRDFLIDLVDEVNNDELVITSSSVNNIEVNDKMAQKGLALMSYANERGYKPEEVMAIGDNFNDYSMIEMAGVGVAMKNAIPEIRNIANITTDSNVNNGVAKVIRKAIEGL